MKINEKSYIYEPTEENRPDQTNTFFVMSFTQLFHQLLALPPDAVKSKVKNLLEYTMLLREQPSALRGILDFYQQPPNKQSPADLSSAVITYENYEFKLYTTSSKEVGKENPLLDHQLIRDLSSFLVSPPSFSAFTSLFYIISNFQFIEP